MVSENSEWFRKKTRVVYVICVVELGLAECTGYSLESGVGTTSLFYFLGGWV